MRPPKRQAMPTEHELNAMPADAARAGGVPWPLADRHGFATEPIW